MDFKFEETEHPVRAGSPGRTAEPNPFVDTVKSIALAVNSDGKPLTLAFTAPTKTEDEQALVRKYRRQLADAGLLVDPQVTVFVSEGPVTKMVKGESVIVPNLTRITFWTTRKIRKPRKVAAETTTATA